MCNTGTANKCLKNRHLPGMHMLRDNFWFLLCKMKFFEFLFNRKLEDWYFACSIKSKSSRVLRYSELPFNLFYDVNHIIPIVFWMAVFCTYFIYAALWNFTFPLRTGGGIPITKRRPLVTLSHFIVRWLFWNWAMEDSSAINSGSEDPSDTSFSSTGSQKPLIHKERNRCLVAFVVVISLILIWGIALLPAIFYANKLPAPVEQQVNMR